ncbi:hypothetical protein ACEZDB_32805 [Streptacidiphilus sp. N1-3]|uniref:Outer membrane channel protein CpnT-like N-terminal domain-containing protein n=1 Tax=Streptacidiphilus alkalitolerans TaxID=3342712 RepID=A0ABV6XB01_9ACTN
MSINLPPELGWVARLAVGQAWPKGDEDKMIALGAAWNDAAQQLVNLSATIDPATSGVLNSIGGQVADQFHDFTAQLRSSLPDMADAAGQMGQLGHNTGVQLEYSKYMILAQLVWLAYELVQLAFWAPEAVPAAITAARLIVQMILKRLLQSVVMGVGFMVGMDVAIQTIQFLKGDRTKWDTSLTLSAVESGAISGGIGGILHGVGGAFAPKFTGSLIGKGTIGAVTGVVSTATMDGIFGGEGDWGATLSSGIIGAMGGGGGRRRFGGGEGEHEHIDGDIKLPSMPDLHLDLPSDLGSDLGTDLPGEGGGFGEKGLPGLEHEAGDGTGGAHAVTGVGGEEQQGRGRPAVVESGLPGTVERGTGSVRTQSEEVGQRGAAPNEAGRGSSSEQTSERLGRSPAESPSGIVRPVADTEQGTTDGGTGVRQEVGGANQTADVGAPLQAASGRGAVTATTSADAGAQRQAPAPTRTGSGGVTQQPGTAQGSPQGVSPRAPRPVTSTADAPAHPVPTITTTESGGTGAVASHPDATSGTGQAAAATAHAGQGEGQVPLPNDPPRGPGEVPSSRVDRSPRFVVRSGFSVRRFEVGGQRFADVSVRVAFRDAGGSLDGDATWSRVQQGVKELFNDPGHVLPGGERLHVTVERVGEGDRPDLTVDLVGRGGDMDQHRWAVGAEPAAYAHEVAHQLGLRDEYRDASGPQRPHVAGSLLGDFRQPAVSGLPQSGLRGRHLALLGALIGGDDAEGSVPGPAPVHAGEASPRAPKPDGSSTDDEPTDATEQAEPSTSQAGGTAQPVGAEDDPAWQQARSQAPVIQRQHTWVDPVSDPTRVAPVQEQSVTVAVAPTVPPPHAPAREQAVPPERSAESPASITRVDDPSPLAPEPESTVPSPPEGPPQRSAEVPASTTHVDDPSALSPEPSRTTPPARGSATPLLHEPEAESSVPPPRAPAQEQVVPPSRATESPVPVTRVDDPSTPVREPSPVVPEAESTVLPPRGSALEQVVPTEGGVELSASGARVDDAPSTPAVEPPPGRLSGPPSLHGPEPLRVVPEAEFTVLPPHTPAHVDDPSTLVREPSHVVPEAESTVLPPRGSALEQVVPPERGVVEADRGELLLPLRESSDEDVPLVLPPLGVRGEGRGLGAVPTVLPSEHASVVPPHVGRGSDEAALDQPLPPPRRTVVTPVVREPEALRSRPDEGTDVPVVTDHATTPVRQPRPDDPPVTPSREDAAAALSAPRPLRGERTQVPGDSMELRPPPRPDRTRPDGERSGNGFRSRFRWTRSVRTEEMGQSSRAESSSAATRRPAAPPDTRTPDTRTPAPVRRVPAPHVPDPAWDGHRLHDPAFAPARRPGPDVERQPPPRIATHQQLGASDLLVSLHGRERDIVRQIERHIGAAFGDDAAGRTIAEAFFGGSGLKPRLSALSRGDAWEAPFKAGPWSGKLKARVRVDETLYLSEAKKLEFEGGAEQHMTVGRTRERRNRYLANLSGKFKWGNGDFTPQVGYIYDRLNTKLRGDGARTIARGKTTEEAALFGANFRLELDFSDVTRLGELQHLPGDHRVPVDIAATVAVPRLETGDRHGVAPVPDRLFAPPDRVVHTRRLGGSDIVLDVSARQTHPTSHQELKGVDAVLHQLDTEGERVFGNDLWRNTVRPELKSQIDLGGLHQDLKGMMAGDRLRIEVPANFLGWSKAVVEVGAHVRSMEHQRNTGTTEFNVGTGVSRSQRRQVHRGHLGQLPVVGNVMKYLPGMFGFTGSQQRGRERVEIGGSSHDVTVTTKLKAPGAVFSGTSGLDFHFVRVENLREDRVGGATAEVNFTALVEQSEAHEVQPAQPGQPDPTRFTAAGAATPLPRLTRTPGDPVARPPDSVWGGPDAQHPPAHPYGLRDTVTTRDLADVSALHDRLDTIGRQHFPEVWEDIREEVIDSFSHAMVSAHLPSMTRGLPLETGVLGETLRRHGLQVSATARVVEMEYKRLDTKAELNAVAETGTAEADRTIFSRTTAGGAVGGGEAVLHQVVAKGGEGQQGESGAGGTEAAPKMETAEALDIQGSYAQQRRTRIGWRSGQAGKVYANGKYGQPQALFNSRVEIDLRFSRQGDPVRVHAEPLNAEFSMDARDTQAAQADARGEAVFTRPRPAAAGPAAQPPAPPAPFLPRAAPATRHDPPPRIADRGALGASDVLHSLGPQDTRLLDQVEQQLRTRLGSPLPDELHQQLREQLDPFALKGQLSRLTRGGRIVIKVDAGGWSGSISVGARMGRMTHTENVDNFEFELGSQQRSTMGIVRDQRVRHIVGIPLKFKLPHTTVNLSYNRLYDFSDSMTTEGSGSTVSRGKTVENAGLFTGPADFSVDVNLSRHLERFNHQFPVSLPDTVVAVPLRDAPDPAAVAPAHVPSTAVPDRIRQSHRLGSSDIVTDVHMLPPAAHAPAPAAAHVGAAAPVPVGRNREVVEQSVDRLNTTGRATLGGDWEGMRRKIVDLIQSDGLVPALKPAMSGGEIVLRHGRSEVRISSDVSRLEVTGKTGTTEFNTGTGAQRTFAEHDDHGGSGSPGNVVNVNVLGTSNPFPEGTSVLAGGGAVHSWGHDEHLASIGSASTGMTSKSKNPAVSAQGEARLVFTMTRKPLIRLGHSERVVPEPASAAFRQRVTDPADPLRVYNKPAANGNPAEVHTPVFSIEGGRPLPPRALGGVPHMFAQSVRSVVYGDSSHTVRALRRLAAPRRAQAAFDVGFHATLLESEARPLRTGEPPAFVARPDAAGTAQRAAFDRAERARLQGLAGGSNPPGPPVTVRVPPERVWTYGLRDVDVTRWIGDSSGIGDIIRMRGPRFFDSGTWRRLSVVARQGLGHSGLSAGFNASTRGDDITTPTAGRLRLLTNRAQIRASVRVLNLEYQSTDRNVELSPAGEISGTTRHTGLSWHNTGGQLQIGAEGSAGSAEATGLLTGGYQHRKRAGAMLEQGGRVIASGKFNTPMARFTGYAEVTVTFVDGGRQVQERGVVPVTLDIPENETGTAQHGPGDTLLFSDDRRDGRAPVPVPVGPLSSAGQRGRGLESFLAEEDPDDGSLFGSYFSNGRGGSDEQPRRFGQFLRPSDAASTSAAASSTPRVVRPQPPRTNPTTVTRTVEGQRQGPPVRGAGPVPGVSVSVSGSQDGTAPTPTPRPAPQLTPRQAEKAPVRPAVPPLRANGLESQGAPRPTVIPPTGPRPAETVGSTSTTDPLPAPVRNGTTDGTTSRPVPRFASAPVIPRGPERAQILALGLDATEEPSIRSLGSVLGAFEPPRLPATPTPTPVVRTVEPQPAVVRMGSSEAPSTEAVGDQRPALVESSATPSATPPEPSVPAVRSEEPVLSFDVSSSSGSRQVASGQGETVQGAAARIASLGLERHSTGGPLPRVTVSSRAVVLEGGLPHFGRSLVQGDRQGRTLATAVRSALAQELTIRQRDSTTTPLTPDAIPVEVVLNEDLDGAEGGFIHVHLPPPPDPAP